MNFDAIIFDLDGTLWDTCEAVAWAWNRVIASNHLSFRTIHPADIRAVTGKPHDECVRSIFKGFTEAQLVQLIADTEREDILAIREMGGVLYPGVAEGLLSLSQNYPLYIVSNCQSGYIENFLVSKNCEALFKDHECWGNTQKNKSENLKTLIARNNLRAPVYVGDTAGDQKAAVDCQIPFAFVEYGFGYSMGPDLWFSDFSELTQTLLKKITLKNE